MWLWRNENWKVALNPADIVNKNLPADTHCASISQDFVALIPPPKEKKSRAAKPKAEKPPKEAKPKAKPRGKASQKVEISTEPATITLN